jgi:adhesin transport system membrane fusion protein
MRLEEAFANDVRAALDSERTRKPWPLLAVCGGLFLAGLAWAGLTTLEEHASAPGKVIPSSQIQVVQTLEPGILAALLVKVGDTVEAGQVLMRLSDASVASQLGEIRQRRSALLARRERLAAEVEGRTPDFDAADADPASAQAERRLFEDKAAALAQEVAVAERQLAQRRQERSEADVRLSEADRLVQMLERELDMARGLAKRGVFPEIELMRQERVAQAERREATVLRAALPRLGEAVAEAESRLKGLVGSRRAAAQDELVKTLGDLAVLEESVKAVQDRERRTALRSPVRGVVNALPVSSIGAVLQTGQHAAEIVPLDDSLQVECHVRPQDIAFIGAGQHASVKVSAYDYTVYGELPGEVMRIGADTKTDPQGNAYYEVIVRTARTALGTPEKPLPIIPGMVVRVDIQTGEKSVLAYLLKPLRKAAAEAMRER